jgi:hypothetical protein
MLWLHLEQLHKRRVHRVLNELIEAPRGRPRFPPSAPSHKSMNLFTVADIVSSHEDIEHFIAGLPHSIDSKINLASLLYFPLCLEILEIELRNEEPRLHLNAEHTDWSRSSCGNWEKSENWKEKLFPSSSEPWTHKLIFPLHLRLSSERAPWHPKFRDMMPVHSCLAQKVESSYTRGRGRPVIRGRKKFRGSVRDSYEQRGGRRSRTSWDCKLIQDFFLSVVFMMTQSLQRREVELFLIFLIFILFSLQSCRENWIFP